MAFSEQLINPVLDHPYVRMVIESITDKSLFKMSKNDLADKRKMLLREHLKYLRDQSDFYADMLKNVGVNPDNATIEDIIKLAISSNQWRGDGYRKYLIPPIQNFAEKAEHVDDPEKYGKWVRSSGTTGQVPVRVYRSQLDLAIQEHADIAIVANFIASKESGIGLILAAEEMKYDLGFIYGVEDFLKQRGAEVVWGMQIDETVEAKTIFAKMRPDKKAIASFLKSEVEPKFILTAPVGIWQMLKGQDAVNKLRGIKGFFAKKMSGLDKPIDLGKGGVLFSGGGTKSIAMPPLEELISSSRERIIARDEHGNQIPAPWIDTLAQTENITLLTSCSQWKDGQLVLPDSLLKTPHPLAEVVLVDPRTHKIVGPGQEGEFLYYNPFSLSVLEAFYPGEIGRTHKKDNCYGQSFEFVRSLQVDEGGLDRACGGKMEEMMESNIKEVESNAA